MKTTKKNELTNRDRKLINICKSSFGFYAKMDAFDYRILDLKDLIAKLSSNKRKGSK